MKKNVTDLDIQALLDGELEPQKLVQIMETVRNDPSLYNRYLVYKKQKSLLKSWWKDH